MALKITYIKEQAPAPKVVASKRLYRTADGERLVPEGHADAAFLFCAPGQEVPRAEFEEYELDRSLGKAVVAEDEPESETEASAEEEQKEVEGPPSDKAQDRPEDKAVRKRRTKKSTRAA